MSSMVCQGLQSCLEPRFVEPIFVEPRGLGLKMAPTTPLFSRTTDWSSRKSCTSDSDSDSEEQNIHNNTHMDLNNTPMDLNNTNEENTNTDINKNNDGWSLIQALTSSTQIRTIQEKEAPYVHPLDKRYSSKLSKKSLELCTENLGCETGSDISSDISDYSDICSTTSSDSEGGKSSTRDQVKYRHNWGSITKKVNYGSLPPPLTSISGANSVQIRPHREGGRLVIKKVAIPTPQTYFQAERCDGRLRLHLIKSCDILCPPQNPKFEEVIQEEKCYDKKEEEIEKEYEEEQEESENEYELEVDQESNEENDYLDEDMEGNDNIFRTDIGKEKFQRRSRCNENGQGKNGLLNWEPFWVTT